MNSARTAVITRITENHWHALEDDRVVGRGVAMTRPDGRVFLGIDAWHDAVWDQLARAVLADLPRPLHTVVDEADADLRAHWARAGFTTLRREWEYVVSTDVSLAAQEETVLPVGSADEAPLRALDRAVRAETDPARLPAEVLPWPFDASKYAVATRSGEYVGLLRLTNVERMPRLGLVAVRAGFRRQGVATALLASVLRGLNHAGKPVAVADVPEANEAAVALFDGIGARRTASALELVVR